MEAPVHNAESAGGWSATHPLPRAHVPSSRGAAGYKERHASIPDSLREFGRLPRSPGQVTEISTSHGGNKRVESRCARTMGALHRPAPAPRKWPNLTGDGADAATSAPKRPIAHVGECPA